MTLPERATLAAYCQLFEQWVTAERYIKEQLVIVDKPTGRIVQNPLLRITHRTLDLMIKFMIELGLTPASRVRLTTGAPPVEDPLEQFLTRKPRR